MKIAKNFMYNSIYQLITIILPIITIPYVSRVLGAEGIGKYVYTNAYAQYFILVGMIGLSFYSTRQIAYVRDSQQKLNKVFWELNILRFITMGISLIFYIIIFLVINQKDKFIYLIQGLYILASIADISWYFMGLENFKKTVTKNIVTKVAGVILIFLLVKRQDQVWMYILILGSSQLLGQLLMWINIPKFISLKSINIHDLYLHIYGSFKFFIPQIAIQVYTLMDRTMLGLVKGESEVGIYDNSQKIIRIILTLLTSLATVMMPYMSNMFANKDMEKFKISFKRAFSFTSFMSFPMTIGLISISRSFVPWFFGKQFVGLEYLMYVGSWMMIPIAWSSVLGTQVMISMKKENLYTISVSIAAVINIVLNILLIPKLSSMGTTISSLAAECVGTIIQVYFLRDFIRISSLFKGIHRYIFGSLLMFVIIKGIDRFLNTNILSTFIEILIGFFVYFIVMYIIKDENFQYIFDKIINSFKYNYSKYMVK